MKRRIPRKGQKRSAFTLLEVLLVLIIIVVIAGFSAQNLMGTFETAKKNQAKSQIGMFSSMLKRYQLTVGSFPSDLNALYEMPSDIQDQSLWTQSYDKPIPPDPWNRPYEYKNNGSSFEIRSAGPDGQSGTQDDIIS